MRMTKTNILSLATIATGIAISVLGSIYVYNIERTYWGTWGSMVTQTSITLLVGIVFILIGIAGLVKTRKKEVIKRRKK